MARRSIVSRDQWLNVAGIFHESLQIPCKWAKGILNFRGREYEAKIPQPPVRR